jgi:hypothetical protein
MEREDEIKQLAYCLWEQEGCCQGRDIEYWLKAEVIWEEKQKAPPKAEAPVKTAEKPVEKPQPATRNKSIRNRHTR